MRRGRVFVLLGLGLCLLLYPAAGLLTEFAAKNPYMVEEVYSRGIYPLFSQPISWITGIFPFSVLELAAALAVIFVPWYIIRSFYKAYTRRDAYIAVRGVASLLAVFSVGFFLLTSGWSLNYYRPTFAELEGIEEAPADKDELIRMCLGLSQRAAEIREGLSVDENGLVKLPYSPREAFSKVQAAYDAASKAYPLLGGNYGAPKPALFSALLSKLKIAGIFVPFTMEAHVNIMEVDYMLPVTACHEAAHQRGFAREDEANFIAYRVCMMSDDPYFQYSGVMLALTNSMNALAKVDGESWLYVRQGYDVGVALDIEADSDFWRAYDTPVAKASANVHDSFLKSNGQSSGIKSYGYMVDLLIAGWKEEE